MAVFRRTWISGSLLLALGAVAFLLATSMHGDDSASPAVPSSTLADTAAEGVIGPDVIVGVLIDTFNWGTVGDITAYSVGTTSCNKGDEVLEWTSDDNRHPVIGQNMYRHKDGRLEQIGQSWLKHGFATLAQNACGFGCQNPGSGSLLGVGCSDPYDAGLNGSQGSFFGGGLGPRFEVNAATGHFEYPYTYQGDSGDDIYKRLQVLVAEVDPAQNASARYFVEGQYVTADDAEAGNNHNNTSYREVSVENDLDLNFVAPTVQELPAIHAWQALDASVAIEIFDVPDDGRFRLATKVSDNGDGTWRYEYAIHNETSHRSAKSFTVPMEPGTAITNVGFRDVPYHSGEPYDNIDWTHSVDTAGGTVAWSVDRFFADGFESGNTDAWGGGVSDVNALRWGTMYNFWFDANRAPNAATVSVGLFRPGSPASMSVASTAPVPVSPF